MKLVPVTITEYRQEPGMSGCYKAVADASRVCYQSLTKKDPREFVDMLIRKGHTRPLEFGKVYLCITTTNPVLDKEYIKKEAVVKRYMNNGWSTVCSHSNDGHHVNYYITTNLAVIAQGYYKSVVDACEGGFDKSWFGDMCWWCEPTAFHNTFRTFDIVCSRGAADDMRTHITLSSLAESTRYCNYSKGKFGNELTFIEPYWDDVKQREITLRGYTDAERNYMMLAETGAEPQQCKRLYPLGAKTELMLCGDNEAWRTFLYRRCDEHADPEVHIVAEGIKHHMG